MPCFTKEGHINSGFSGFRYRLQPKQESPIDLPSLAVLPELQDGVSLSNLLSNFQISHTINTQSTASVPFKLNWNSRKANAKRVQQDVWEGHRQELEQLYRDNTLDGVMSRMKVHHGFVPTKDQYIFRFKQWQVSKQPQLITASTATAQSNTGIVLKRPGQAVCLPTHPSTAIPVLDTGSQHKRSVGPTTSHSSSCQKQSTELESTCAEPVRSRIARSSPSPDCRPNSPPSVKAGQRLYVHVAEMSTEIDPSTCGLDTRCGFHLSSKTPFAQYTIAEDGMITIIRCPWCNESRGLICNFWEHLKAAHKRTLCKAFCIICGGNMRGWGLLNSNVTSFSTIGI